MIGEKVLGLLLKNFVGIKEIGCFKLLLYEIFLFICGSLVVVVFYFFLIVFVIFF